MQYVIYLDVIFLNQFVMNLCALFIANSIRSVYSHKIRMIVASLIAAGAGCLAIMVTSIPYIVKYPYCAIFPQIILVLVAYPRVGIINIIKNSMAVLFGCFLLGGISTCICRVFPFLQFRLYYLFVMILITLAVYQGIRCVRKKYKRFYPVTIYFSQESVISVIALADTGNCLCDENGKGVCIINRGICPESFSTEQNFSFCALGTEEGNMRGGYIEKMIIHMQDENRVFEQVPIAIYSGQISKNGKCEMILQSNYFM